MLVLDRPVGSANLFTSLLWTGEEYLFFWRVFAGDGVFMLRLDASGQAIGGNIRVRGYENAFDVAWGGDRLAAAWIRQSAGTDGDLMFQTFDGLGRPLIDAVTLRSAPDISTDASVNYGPRIASIAGGFVIAWNQAAVMLATVDLDGRLRDGPVAVGESDLATPRYLSVAAASDRILVGWTGKRFAPAQPPPSGFAMMTGAFSGGLQPLRDSEWLDIAEVVSRPQVLATGSGFLALWTHGLELNTGPVRIIDERIAQFDSAGAFVATRAVAPIGSRLLDVAPAAWNSDHLVALADSSSDAGGYLTISRLAPDGARQGEFVGLPTMSAPQRLTVTAHDRTVGFIWSEEIAGAYEVYFQQAKACP